jgi:DNA-binding MarR family transcriptional regulator
MYGGAATSPGLVAERTGLTRGAVSKLVDRLVSKKLVTRVGRKDDRRFQSLSLTPAGHRLVPELATKADQNDAEFFSALSEGEHATLIATLKKLVEANRLKKLPVD